MRCGHGRRIALALAALAPAAAPAEDGPRFDARSARSGRWSDPATWEGERAPRAGDRVQVQSPHAVIYDVESEAALRMVHVAGTLAFSRERSTRLEVGLLKVQAGGDASEDGFTCDAHPPEAAPGAPRAALEIGTPDDPIPAGVTARIRLVHFPGMDRETLPAIVSCGGRWDAHGAPMSRTWVKLGAPARPGDTAVTLAEPVSGWRAGDRVIITASLDVSFRKTFRRRPDGTSSGDTEERLVAGIEGRRVTLDRPLLKEHFGGGELRSEVANLSRNVVIESADPAGVRGHTMYHRGSAGGISYAEFRHLGKEGVLGKYSIHFHLVRDSMRGSAVVGASIWDSHNRWITVHGTDYLLVRDCVGYQSVGHGFFLEDATEQYNVLDRNLAVQAAAGKRLKGQVLPFDPNDGAGFWWANGRNTLVRNVSAENDEYGFRFEIARRSDFDPVLRMRSPEGAMESRDVRTIPFFRFEDNEAHSEGLYGFNFGDDRNPSVRGDRQHPFVARDLRAWRIHYALRPNLQFFLAEGLTVNDAAYGVYHPDYDAHVYRGVRMRKVNAEPINRGHDDESIQYGSFTYQDLRLEDCRLGRDPLIQMACTSPGKGREGHFRGLSIVNSQSPSAKVVDLGGGPRLERVQNGVAYYFHDTPAKGRVLRVVSGRFEEMRRGGDYGPLAGFTGRDVVAAEVEGVEFPVLLEPIDDLPPATMVTSVRRAGRRLAVRGASHDNGTVAAVTVNGQPARVLDQKAGVADWEVEIDPPPGGDITARAKDAAGNEERTAHQLRWEGGPPRRARF